MESKVIANIRVLTPAPGKWLYDRGGRIISDEVWLGKNDTPARWAEITMEEKNQLEAQWAEDVVEPDPDEIMREKAMAYDIMMGGANNA